MGVNLRNRRVAVTGAASGIGRALALEFLREGAKVAALDLNAEALKALEREGKLLAAPLETKVVDVGDRDAFTAALEDIYSAEPPFVFVNNAGIGRAGAALDVGLEGVEKTLRVNLGGTITGTYFALRRMRAADEGVIVNIASLAGLMPSPYLAAYAASKHAVVGLTRSLREELRFEGSRVRLCLVCPGFIDTPILHQDGFEIPAAMRWMIAKPELVARVIVAAVKSGKDEVTPDPSGKAARFLYRWVPGLFAATGRLFVNRSRRS